MGTIATETAKAYSLPIQDNGAAKTGLIGQSAALGAINLVNSQKAAPVGSLAEQTGNTSAKFQQTDKERSVNDPSGRIPTLNAGGGVSSTSSSSTSTSGSRSPAYVAPTNDEANIIYSRQIDPKTETIEGRVQNLLNSDNAVINQAKNRTYQEFAKRGLLDSSMAVQAAQEAMTAKAIDIAGPDAAAYQTQGKLNQTEANKSKIMTQEYGQKGNLQTDEYGLKGNLMSQEYGLKGDLQTKEYGLKGILQQQQDAAALERTKVGLEEQKLQNTSNNARAFSEGILKLNQDYTDKISIIQQNTKMDDAQKAAAVQIQTDIRDSNIQAWNQASKSLPGWTEEWAVVPTYTTAPVVEPAPVEQEVTAPGLSQYYANN